MNRITTLRRLAREWGAALLGISAIAIALGVYFHEARRTTYRLTISGGSMDGLRHQIARSLETVCARRGVTLELVGTSGSEESLDRIEAGTLDLALVQGGLNFRDRPHVRQVAALKIEPLHLLVKSEIEPTELRGLEILRGRSVNLSEVGSGTYDLSREVLGFAGLHPETDAGPDAADYKPATLSYKALLAEPDRSKLPDAVFTVSALPSPVVKHLVTHRGFRIVPLRFGVAFALDALHAPRPVPPPDARHGELHGVDRVHVYNTEIPPYTYSVTPPIPPAPVPTFGTRLLLVAGADQPAAAIAQLLEGSYLRGPGGPALDPSLADLPPEMDWHDGVAAYRERNKPLEVRDAVDLLEKGTSLFGAILGGTFFLWHWYRQRVRRHRDLGFEAYMLKVAAVEGRALDLETAAKLDLKELLHLQVELSRLKGEALEKFAEGSLQGEELISGFVTHVNDARNYLTRLILHERENIEEEAVTQHRSAESVWNEEVGEVARSHDMTAEIDLDRGFTNPPVRPLPARASGSD